MSEENDLKTSASYIKSVWALRGYYDDHRVFQDPNRHPAFLALGGMLRTLVELLSKLCGSKTTTITDATLRQVLAPSKGREKITVESVHNRIWNEIEEASRKLGSRAKELTSANPIFKFLTTPFKVVIKDFEKFTDTFDIRNPQWRENEIGMLLGLLLGVLRDMRIDDSIVSFAPFRKKFYENQRDIGQLIDYFRKTNFDEGADADARLFERTLLGPID